MLPDTRFIKESLTNTILWLILICLKVRDSAKVALLLFLLLNSWLINKHLLHFFICINVVVVVAVVSGHLLLQLHIQTNRYKMTIYKQLVICVIIAEQQFIYWLFNNVGHLLTRHFWVNCETADSAKVTKCHNYTVTSHTHLECHSYFNNNSEKQINK